MESEWRWIKLFVVKIVDSAVFEHEPLLKLWIYLLRHAAWKECQLSDGTVLKPGQMVRGFRRIAADLKWGISKVQRWAGTLERLGNIERHQRGGTLAQIITICNWETYQGNGTLGGTQPGTQPGTLGGTQPGTNSRITRSIEEQEKDIGNKPRFVPPSVEEVQEYCKERGNSVNPETFIDFYASKGWYVGKNKMKDWKACVRTWEQNSRNQQGKPISLSTRDMDFGDIFNGKK